LRKNSFLFPKAGKVFQIDDFPSRDRHNDFIRGRFEPQVWETTHRQCRRAHAGVWVASFLKGSCVGIVCGGSVIPLNNFS